MKSEPDEFSIDDLMVKGNATWDGVRNYQARNFIRQMQMGDEVLFYHSSCKSLRRKTVGAPLKFALKKSFLIFFH